MSSGELDLNDLKLFALVVEHGGYAAAERASGVPKSRLSRRIAQLEEDFGVRLIQRSTRKFAVTEVGQNVFKHAQSMLAQAQAAQEAVQVLSAEPRGVVRVSCPVSLSQRLLSRVVPGFLIKHPKVRLQAFLQAAIDTRAARETDTLSVYIPNPFHGGDWMRARLGSRRPLASVVLKAGQGEALLADLERFFDSRERYAQLGIPWRRGYLLYGPPGTGKTSLVTALASELHLNVCTLSLASPIVTDEKIHTLLASVPQRSLLLIEDVDAFFRERDAAHAQVKLSFSGFLNALDGVATQEGTVLFMTTNHVERLDPALIRAGRIDERVELGYADEEQLRRLYRKFHDDAAAAEAFAREKAGQNLAPAAVQGELMRRFGATPP